MTKIGYVTIGAKDNDASVKFYDAVFTALGDERKFSDGGWTGYGIRQAASVAIGKAGVFCR